MTNIKPADYLKGITGRIVAVLPAGKEADTYIANIAEYLTRNPDLFQCENHSLQDAIIDAARLGLELGEPFDLAIILPYKNHKKNIILANLVIEYRGHMVQVYAGGKVKAIEARAVYEADQFEYIYGKNPVLNHQPSILAKRGGIIHAYAIAQLQDGGTAVEVINRHDADRARADSPGSGRPDSLWVRREADMWIKTAIKKLVNRLPRSASPAVGSGFAGPGPIDTPAPEEYEKLFNAVLIAPDTYKQAINELPFDFPLNSESIHAVLDLMRARYRAETKMNQATAA